MNINRPEYLDPTLRGCSYIYGKEESSYALFVVSLTMRIVPELLEQAMNEALVRYPQFSVGFEENADCISFRPISDTLHVFDESSDVPCSFADERLNGHVICLSYLHKTLFFRYHRAIADEHGMIAFIKSVIYRYMELGGYPVENDGTVKLLSSSYFKAESDDPMEKVEDYPASRPVWYMDATAVRPEPLDSDGEEVSQIRIPLAKLSKNHEALANEPVTYLAPLFSDSVNEYMKGRIPAGEYVVASIQINLRTYFPTASLRPFHTPVFLAYNRKLGDYPYNTVLMSQKKLLEAQLKTDALAYSAQRMIADVEKAYKGSLEQKRASFAALYEKISCMSTYSVCRLGNLILPDQLQRYVTEFYPVLPAVDQAYSLTVVNFRGDMYVTVSGKKDVKLVTDRFVELLNGNGIYAFKADGFILRYMK